MNTSKTQTSKLFSAEMPVSIIDIDELEAMVKNSENLGRKAFTSSEAFLKAKPLSALKGVDDSVVDLIIQAAAEHLKRKNRLSNPAGTFDSAKRFYLSDKCECCSSIRSPSRSYPFSEMTHGRSAEHVAHEFGVEDHVTLVRKFAKVIGADGLRGVYALLLDRSVYVDKHMACDLGL